MTDTPADAATLSLRVYYEDTDAGGVVYYANYAKYLERGRTEWLRSLGVNQVRLAADEKRLFVVTSLAIQYRRPAKLDDTITVYSCVNHIGKASIKFGQRVMRNGELLCDATVEVCCVHADTFRPAPIPADLRTLMEKVPS